MADVPTNPPSWLSVNLGAKMLISDEYWNNEIPGHEMPEGWELLPKSQLTRSKRGVLCTYPGCTKPAVYTIPPSISDGDEVCENCLSNYNLTQNCHPCAADSSLIGRGFNIRPLHRVGLNKLVHDIISVGWNPNLGILDCTFVHKDDDVRLAVFAGQHRYEALIYLCDNTDKLPEHQLSVRVFESEQELRAKGFQL